MTGHVPYMYGRKLEEVSDEELQALEGSYQKEHFQNHDIGLLGACVS